MVEDENKTKQNSLTIDTATIISCLSLHANSASFINKNEKKQ